MNLGFRAGYVASLFATRLMLGRSAGLIINLSSWAARKHIGKVVYGMAKAVTDKMTADMAVESDSHGISVIRFHPGVVRTERVMEHAAHVDLSNSESPRSIGRVVAALLSRPEWAKGLTGNVCTAAQLANDWAIADVDGYRPIPLSADDA